MAKKKEILTMEEQLKQALVPESEQPYEVPSNWIWTRLENIVSVSKEKTEDFSSNQKYIGLENIVSGKGINNVGTSGKLKSLKNIFFEGQILYGRLRPYLNKHDIATFDGVCSTDILVFVANRSIVEYINYFLDTVNVIEYAVGNSKGINLPRISEKVMLKCIYPLPPLAEQERIVNRIESLFSKLDQAKELAQSALDSFTNRKSVILHQAFTGELTKNWRKQNGVSLDSWEEKKLQSVCITKITDGTHQTPVYADRDTGVPFISSKDVTKGYIDWSKIKFITKELHEKLYARIAPQIDDVLLAKNGTTGVAAIVDSDKIFDIYVTLAVLRPNKTMILPLFLLNIVNSPICKKQFNDNLTGIGVPNLHLRDIREVIISIPTISEQKEIVRILDSLFEKEQQAKHLTNIIEKVDHMKKAILARAFRGELGTNIPEEESAIELLKEILEKQSSI